MKTRRIATVFLAVIAASGCAWIDLRSGSPVIDRIRARGEIRIGMTGDYPPLNVLDVAGRNIGLEPDLARTLAQVLRVELVVVNKPFSELIPALETGEVDAVMSGMTMSPERNMRVAFAGPYFVSGKAVLTKSDPLAKAKAARELNRSTVRLTALEGTTSLTLIEEGMPSATALPAKSYQEAVRRVIDGEADAMIADYPICVISWLRNPGVGLKTWIEPFTFEPLGIGLPANDPLFVNLVQNYLKSLEETGLLTRLRESWFSDAAWLDRVP